MLPPEGRLLRFLFRDRDFEDLMDMLSASLLGFVALFETTVSQSEQKAHCAMTLKKHEVLRHARKNCQNISSSEETYAFWAQITLSRPSKSAMT